MITRTFRIPAARPDKGAPSATRWLALAVLCVSLLIVTLDNTVLNVALPTLVRDLHATTTQLQWIVDAYVMVFAGPARWSRAAWRTGSAANGCSWPAWPPSAAGVDLGGVLRLGRAC